ncbi:MULTISPECIES: hypothetical protein [Rhodococcus]|uniref:hypothetical protein n=1 Tax=Rhodococcus TaxID=1827 RepID=UPI000B2CAD68|nr:MULTISPECIES: hypothetical protein [Rhodococcus]UTM39877.1 hypothetical protein MX572_24115 [Rhodococcus pyridinivorans]
MTGPGLDDWDEQFPGMPILWRPPEPIEVMVDVSRALPAAEDSLVSMACHCV